MPMYESSPLRLSVLALAFELADDAYVEDEVYELGVHEDELAELARLMPEVGACPPR